MKLSVITLFGRVMNNNVELSSDWLFHSAAHFSSSHINKSLLSDVNDGEIRHPTLYVTLDHKNSHKGLFYFEIEMYTQSES